MNFQKGFVLIKGRRQILLQSVKLLFVEIRSQNYPSLRRISIEPLQQTKESNLSRTFLLLAKQSNRRSFLSTLSKKGYLMAQQTITKLLFDSFICQSFVNMYTPLFKFIILIEFSDSEIEKNISLQVCYYFISILHYPYVETLYTCRAC